MPQERWQPSVRESRYDRRRERLPRLFSEGDSWFDYPPHPNIIDYIDDSERWAIKRFERSGEWLKEMIPSLPRVLAALEQERPLCLLLSGGGNDVADKNVAPTLFRQFQNGLGAPELLNRPVWNAKLAEIEANFLLYMDAVNEFVPLVVHGYDYLVPSPRGAKYDGFRVSGPWLQPAMRDCGITNEQLQREIGHLLIEEFNEMLAGLQRKYPLHFIYVNLRGMFTPNNWANEIHLNRSSFRRVANVFMDVIDNRLPDVLRARQEAGL
ncbi:MAG TPA: hypothetical protein VF432_19250 [Thermoanaerobaculia bacterium]